MTDNPLIVAPRERVVEIYSGDVEARLESVTKRMIEAAADDNKPKRAATKSDALDLAVEHDDIVKAAKDEAVKVTLRAVPHRTFRQLQDSHPKRDGNKRDEVYGVNEDTFFRALVQASLLSPEVTPEQFADFADTVSAAAWIRLANAAYELATGDVSLPKSSAVSVLRRMRESGTQQPDETE